MGRRMLLGVALLVGIVTSSAWPEAAPRTAPGEATFAFGWIKDEPTLRIEGRGVKFFKRVGRNNVSIRVEVPGDVIELEADVSGAVRYGRKGRFLRLQMKDDVAANIAKVQKLTAGSRALDGFEGLGGLAVVQRWATCAVAAVVARIAERDARGHNASGPDSSGNADRRTVHAGGNQERGGPL